MFLGEEKALNFLFFEAQRKGEGRVNEMRT